MGRSRKIWLYYTDIFLSYRMEKHTYQGGYDDEFSEKKYMAVVFFDVYT
jgi:hypothetical protein